MNYNGNMPDWHQYNPSQSGINDVTSTGQNINSGHFISSINPTCSSQLSTLNLSSEGLEKHQNDSNINPRHFQPHLPGNIPHGHNAVADNTPLASMAQMQNCISHYGPSNTRNTMVDNLNGPMDPRGAAIGGPLNEELGYRSNQVSLNGPIAHHGPNVMNMNVPHGPIPPRSTNVNSHAAGRTGPPPPSFAPCKALCCNPDPNMSYQQYCSYQNNAAYRENIRSSAGYQADARRFSNDYNFRKDNFDGKDVPPPPSMMQPHNVPNVDHRRNFSDPIKYRKDRLVSRGYPSASNMLHNYSMQNYNYAEYQKYPYGVKDYSKVGGMNVPGQGIGVKQHGQEQGFAMPQQKYNSGKQVPPYQSNNGMMPSGMPSASNVPPNPGMMNPAAQNTYYNSQYPRNLSTETAHGCGAPQETADNVQMQANRIQTSTMPHTTPPHPRYQEYQQKLTMHRFSIENHLKKLSRMPDYQTHPEYKEYVHKYNEIVNLERQQFAYQGQMQQQQQTASCVAVSAATVNPPPTVPPINLQFDRNGVLINSNYLPEAFSRVQQVVNPPQAPVDSGAADKQGKQNGKSVAEMASHSTVQKPEQMLPMQQHAAVGVLCPEGIQQGKQDQYPTPKSLDQRQFEVAKAPGYGSLNASDTAAMQQKMQPKVLDVRQFLANWDESEDEDGANAGNLPEAVLSDTTPVVVVGYENVDLSAKALEGLNGSKPQEIASSVIAFENHPNKSDVVAAQDCLTISYTENAAEIAKDSTCKELAKVRPGSHIIQCISNEPGEAPTIHIVDNLEISSILQVANGQVAAEAPDAVSFFQEGTEIDAGAIALEADKFKKVDGSGVGESSAIALPDLTSKEKYIVEDSSSSKATETAAASQPAQQVTDQMTMKDNLNAAQDTNLKKQSSFASEESHNPDDISLPDLATSECTPISTTLNTPIHSDNEESSEPVVEDLTIPTNPIEIIQNSPMISFTQSPTKGEPYDHLSDEGADGSRTTDSPGGQYRTEARFKGDGSGDTLDHDTVLGTFEFSENIDKSEADATTTTARNKERASSHENCATTNNNEKTFALDGETESVTEVTGMRMTLTSSEYELKIVSTGAPSKPPRDYKNSTTERHANESQAATVVSQDASVTRKKLPLLPETCAKVAPGRRYGDSELNNALQNITRDPLECGRDDVNCVEKRCVSTELADQTSTSAVNLANDAASRNSRPEDACSTKTNTKSNSSALQSAKHSNLSSGDKSRRCESDKFTRENSSLERKNIDTKDLKSFRHVKHADHRKPASGDSSAISHKKRCLSENTAERCSGEATTHHDKHTQETDARKAKSGKSSKESSSSDVSRSKEKIIENVCISDSDRMRFLKEYRKSKYKSCNVGEGNRSKDAQENKKTDHLVSLNPDERSSNDKQLCQRDAAMLKLSDKQEKRANILRTFVTKNINPDIDIQVTNVNLKLNDNDHQRDPQCSREDAKNGGALDAIKIEINVSCSERNTTKGQLHEDIKNAVAETIGHLTSTISNGARSSSTSITEIPCNKMERCDYERSPATLREASAYNNEAYKDQDNNGEEAVKHKSAIGERGAANEETSNPLVSKKRRNSSLERDQINNAYDDNDNVNVETEPVSSILEISKTEHTASRRRSVQQDAERKVAATNFSVSNEESKVFVDNSSYVGSISKNMQKMDHQEMTAASLSKSARNSQDNIASKSNAIPSSAANSSLEDTRYDNSGHFDYNHFDVAPNEHTDAANDSDKRSDRWKRPKRDDGRFGNFDLYESASGFINPSFFSANERENLNVVPVYTTKDGRITYSPNPRFTYRELLMEARAKESHGSSGVRDSYFARSPSYDYYNCSKLRKVFKRHRDVAAGRKRDVDPADGKSAAKHVDYSPSRSAAKTRDTSHLEFFNDEANKLFANSKNSQQESKESGRKNIVDLSFLEKKYTNKSASSVKHCKTKALANDLDYEKNYNEGSVFDTNLFLEPKSTCEETMESIKSYSSHIDRRNIDGLKEFNFSEIFAVQKRLDFFPLLPAEQNSSDNERKANCDTANESVLHHRAICSFVDDPHTVRDSDARCEKSNVILRNEQESEIGNRNDATAIDVDDKLTDTPDASLNVQRNDEHLTKQESQSEEIKPSAIVPVETPRASFPKVTDEKIYDSERDQCPASDIKDNEAVAEHPVRICNADSSKEDKLDAEEIEIAENVESTENAENVENAENAENVENVENAENVENVENTENFENAENIEDVGNVENVENVGNVESVENAGNVKNAGNVENAEKSEETEQIEKSEKSEDSKQDTDEHLEAANSPEQNAVIQNSPDELKSAEMIEESVHSLNEQDNEMNDSARNNSDSVVDQEILPARQVSSVLNDRKEEQEVALATESNVSIETDQTNTNEQDNACDGNSAVCQQKESITPQNPSVNFMEQTLDEESNERKLQKPEDEERTAEISLKDPEIDEVDNCNSMIISTQPSALDPDLQMARAEENVCDLFANEKREQNISEFTVFKNIIDRKQSQESEVKEHLNCDSIIDSKLLCMDSSDCGIYTEDRCTLAQMSEHDFTEDDSMVPMEWETSQIQEDAVNRLCSIDESIDFAGAAGSLQDNSLLDNLSLSQASTSAIKEFAVPERIMESESRTNGESAAVVDSTPITIEESKPSDSNDDDDDDDGGKEPNQVSSSSYEKVAYLRAMDCNANMKMVPKLVIKKSEANSKSFITKLSTSASSVPSVNSKSSYQPKIPKMIIRNARSRPGTPSIPSIEAVHEEASAPQASTSERTSLLAIDEPYDNDSNQSSLHESSQGHRNKIPKMKIKLDEKHSSKIITAEDSMEVCARRRNLKKSSSKESRRSSPRDPDRHEERLPVLKLRKAERNRSSSPEGAARKRQSLSHSDVPVKKCKRSGRGDEAGHSTTQRSSSSDSTRMTASECETRRNPVVCISEKIPKVIIKRTSASAEFKCEFSKGCKSVIARSAKWQPEVKLERYRILDSMVRDLKSTLSPISLRTVEKIFASGRDIRRQQEGDHKLSRSNSTSDLLPVKCKERRMSDYDCRKVSDALNSDLSLARDADVKSTRTMQCITPKRNVSSKNHSRPIDGGPKDDRRRSRSRDNSNLQMETDVTDKETDQSFERTGTALSQNDERKIDDLDVHHEHAARVDKDRQEDTPVKYPSNSTDFRVALKELRATSKTEDCFAKLPDLSKPLSVEIDLPIAEKEQQRERDDQLFFGENNSKILIKKERLSCSSDLDCTLQDDIGLLKDDSADMLGSFGTDKSSIIKIESSDDSQSTIEILPASPNNDDSELENNIIEDGDSEQLYSADAIPTQFELELEIADNSNMDLLEMNMPKLDLIPDCSSHRVFTEKPCGDQASTAGHCNKSESLSRGRNLHEKDKHAVANDVSALESDSAGSVRSPYHRTAGSVVAREYFCCNDSLIKEVLAAKETLKKCLSRSRCEESGVRLKTVAEKKQGSSFDLNSLSKTHSKSDDATQGACRSDVGAPQATSTLAASKHKTDSTSDVGKFDKKHSKQSKSFCVKKKSKSPEKNEDRADSREATRSALESATISLKAFRHVGQAASNESRTVYLSEKRKNSADHQGDIPQLQDSQRKEGSKWSSYKIPKISKSTDRGRVADGNARNSKPREDNMPVLEPAIAMDLDSDRDSSRSPPVITIQDGEDVEITEAKLADDKTITSADTKDVHKKSEMSTIDFISQFVYHEKATIKHRRYCNLCERWFPTKARHQRHLAGYQHRHIELTQRRSIHTLFMLFTGKTCPWLDPAHVMRSCELNEPTPLQIAIQDVAKCFDTQQSPKKQNDVDK